MDAAQCEQIGKAFIDQYYEVFDKKASRAAVSNFYHPLESTLVFEGDSYKGAEKIIGKISELPFGDLFRKVTTHDCQPVQGAPPGILIQVLGQLRTDSEGDKVMAFSQTFVLRHIDNNFFLTNDIFRLVLHNYAAS